MMGGAFRVLAVIVLALAIGLASLWFDRNGQRRPVRWQPPVPVTPVLGLSTVYTPPAEALAGLETITARPLFAPDRRPPPPPPPPAPPDPLADAVVQGLVSGDAAGALIRIEGRVRLVKLGATVGPWTLSAIDGPVVTLKQGEQTRQLRLTLSRLRGEPPSTPVPPKPGASRPGIPSAPIVGDDPASRYRENLRQRNLLRAARGLPLLTE
ncbi:MAG: hypothetical protein OHK0048_03770 [Rhodoferax sp.]